MYCSAITSSQNFCLQLYGPLIHKGLLYTGKYGKSDYYFIFHISF